MINLTQELEPLTILRAVTKELPNFFELEPVIVEEALGLSTKNCERLFAAYTVFHSHKPFEDFHIFQKIVVIFNSRLVHYDRQQELEIPEISWAVKQIRQIDPLTKFSSEVLSYIAVCLYEEGFIEVPVELRSEVSEEGLNIDTLLDDITPNDIEVSEEAKKIQKTKNLLVSHYVKERQAKLDSEVKDE